MSVTDDQSQAQSPGRSHPQDEADETPGASFPVVGIGASAGGLDAVAQLLSNLPSDTGMSFVLVQHLDPAHGSALAEILGRSTTMPVLEAVDGCAMEPDKVYVIPPNRILTVTRGTLKLVPRKDSPGTLRAIDLFFESLAKDQRYCSIGVILSGTGTDGTLGLEGIKAASGITFVQDESAAYDSMPRSAIAAGCVDFVLPPAGIAKELTEIAHHPSMAHYIEEAEEANVSTAGTGEADQAPGNGMERILQALRRHHRVDFSLYKSGTIQRRIRRRMVLNKIDTHNAYADFLQKNSTEHEALYRDLLISVTSFFRNPEAFDALKKHVFVPLAKRAAKESLRAWVVGCSTGQEVYSLAMSFLEISGGGENGDSLQIFATDLNEEALQTARAGFYPAVAVQDVSRERLRRFFVEEPGGYRVQKSLREMCIFARQDLTGDPPFSRLDLITCRNVLIYMDTALQKRALPLFHYALKPDGFLFLGTSESVGTFTDLFEPLDKPHRIFKKKAVPTPPFRMPFSSGHAPAPGQPPAKRAATARAPQELNAQREADRVALNRWAPPGVLIDDALQVLQFRGDTSAYLKPPIGTATLHLLKMTHEGLQQPLLAAINRARSQKESVRVENLRIGPPGAVRMIDVEILPLNNLRQCCYLVMFEEAKASPDTTGKPAPRKKSRGKAASPLPESETRQAGRITDLERELAEARDAAQARQEDYEAASEELQATNEEVQSTNEELQSLNEELETSKEELESTNEELRTVNDELASRNTELNRLNNDLNNLFGSINTAIVLLGRDLVIRNFSHTAGRILNLLPSDIGRPFSRIRHQLKGPEIEPILTDVIDSVTVRECEVQDKDGLWYSLRARPYLTTDNRIDGAVLVLLDIDKQLEAVRFSAMRYRRLFEAAQDGILIVDLETGKIADANPCISELLGRKPEDFPGKELWEIGLLPDAGSAAKLLQRVRNESNYRSEDLMVRTAGGRELCVEMVSNIYQERGVEVMQCNIRDVTERRQAEQSLRESEGRFRALGDSIPQLAWAARGDGFLYWYNRRWYEYTGTTPEQMEGWGWQSVHDPAMLPLVLERWHAAIAASRPFEMELPLRGADGKYRTFLTRAIPQRDNAGNVVQWYGTNTDITDRIEIEIMLRIAHDTAEDASRAKDQFLATLSHELRTPLTPVLLLSAALENDEALSPEIRADFAMINKNIALEARIIDDLLDLTRISQGKLALRLESVDLRPILEHTVTLLRNEIAEKSLQVTLDLNPAEVHVSGDAVRLQEVFWNILRNAVKFTPTGGKIGVRSSATKDHLYIDFEDSGLGILPEDMPRIFDAFAQGKEAASPRFGGLGLGLSISAIIIREHGGRLWAESAGAGKGSTFHVELPLGVASSHSSAASGSAPEEPRSLSILLVEDHASSREILCRLLTQRGHQVVSANNIANALQSSGSKRFDVVVSDLGLPDGKGYELMRKLRRDFGLPGIALSGYGMEADITESEKSGFKAHLTKPVSLVDLEQAMARVVPKPTV